MRFMWLSFGIQALSAGLHSSTSQNNPERGYEANVRFSHEKKDIQCRFVF